MNVILYETSPSRSLRCRWTLLELGLDYQSVEARPLFHTEELKKVNPMGKVPAAMIDGRPLFESAAICVALADAHPEKDLIAKPGSWDRALHDQWTCFTLSELEAWLWHSARHTFIYPEDQRIAEVIEPNGKEFRKGASVMDDTLKNLDYLVGGTFTVTDIIAGFALNWGRRLGLTEGFDEVNGYLDRLYQRPHCQLVQPD